MRAMLKIAVMGDRDTVVGFKALGLEVFPLTGAEEARQVFRKITKAEEEYAIIYLQESYAEALSADIAKFKDVPTPAVILIPGKEGPLGLGQTALKEAVERAVGSDIL